MQQRLQWQAGHKICQDLYNGSSIIWAHWVLIILRNQSPLKFTTLRVAGSPKNNFGCDLMSPSFTAFGAVVMSAVAELQLLGLFLVEAVGARFIAPSWPSWRGAETTSVRWSRVEGLRRLAHRSCNSCGQAVWVLQLYFNGYITVPLVGPRHFLPC